MARAIEREVRELEHGRIEFFLGAQLLMRLGDRIIVIGRKRITKRFWAVVVPRGDFGELVGEGEYRLFVHDGHAHLAFDLAAAVPEIQLPRRGSFIVTVMNPDVTVWQGEPHPFQEELFDAGRVNPTPFPADLQARFGERRYSQLDTAEFLDYPGAELVLIAE